MSILGFPGRVVSVTVSSDLGQCVAGPEPALGLVTLRLLARPALSLRLPVRLALNLQIPHFRPGLL